MGLVQVMEEFEVASLRDRTFTWLVGFSIWLVPQTKLGVIAIDLKR
jgi:hypothetical protein